MSLAWNSLPAAIRPPNAILTFYCPTDYEDPFWTKANVPLGANSTSKETDKTQLSYELDERTWAGVFGSPITSYNVASSKKAVGGWLAPSDPRSRITLHMNVHGRTLHVLLNGLNKESREDPPTPAAKDVAAISPLSHIRSGAYTTPTFIIHPRDDDLIPWQHAQRTWEALRGQRVDAEFRMVEDAPHLFDMYRGYQNREAVRKVVAEGYDFLCRYAGL